MALGGIHSFQIFINIPGRWRYLVFGLTGDGINFHLYYYVLVQNNSKFTVKNTQFVSYFVAGETFNSVLTIDHIPAISTVLSTSRPPFSNFTTNNTLVSLPQNFPLSSAN
jgi:hypothetical protein